MCSIFMLIIFHQSAFISLSGSELHLKRNKQLINFRLYLWSLWYISKSQVKHEWPQTGLSRSDDALWQHSTVLLWFSVGKPMHLQSAAPVMLMFPCYPTTAQIGFTAIKVPATTKRAVKWHTSRGTKAFPLLNTDAQSFSLDKRWFV